MPDQSRTGISFEESVKNSFNRAKNDILSLNGEIIDIKALIIKLNADLTSLKENQAIITELVKSNSNSISILADNQKSFAQNNPPISGGTSSKGNERVPRYQELELLKTFRRNKPQLVKQKIVDALHSREMPLYELFTSIVYEQTLCGKTTFYRYMRDLELEGIIEVGLVEGKRIIRRTSSELVSH